MKLYELIVLLNSVLSTEDSNTLIGKIEALFPGAIKQKDDIGYQTVYNVAGIKKGGKGYFVSYLLELDPVTLPEIKQKMTLLKGILRSIFLVRAKNEVFHTYKQINAEYDLKVAEASLKDKKGSKVSKADKKVATEEVEIVVEDDQTSDTSAE